MYPVKKHHHAANYGLNRKRLTENFYESASLLNEVRDYSIARKSIDPRAQMLGGAFQSILGNAKHPEDDHEVIWSKVIGDSVFNITVKEYAEFEITWSATLKVFSDFGECTGLRVVPFINDQMLWSAADRAERRYMHFVGTDWAASAVPTDATQQATFGGSAMGAGGTEQQWETVSGSGIISVANGSFNVGLACAPSMQYGQSQFVDDRWFVLNPKIVLRRVSR